MLVVGERINTSRKSILKAVEERNSRFIQEEAVQQVKAGANIIDVNAGTMREEEVTSLEWLVKIVQEVVDVSLSVDSPNPVAIEAGLKAHRGKAMVNSITGEKERAEDILPLIKKHGACLVALTMDEKGMPETGEERIEIAHNLLSLIKNHGIPAEEVYFDPLIRPIGTDTKQGLAVLKAFAGIMSIGGGVHTICGLSNISFGLPKRRLLNETLLSLAMSAGLDAVILDPLDKHLMAILKAAQAILNKDEFCLQYITASREGKLDT